MDIERLTAIAIRVFFAAAFVLITIAATRYAAGLVGRPILIDLSPGRLQGFASTSLAFVIALLLRQIRDDARAVRRG